MDPLRDRPCSGHWDTAVTKQTRILSNRLQCSPTTDIIEIPGSGGTRAKALAEDGGWVRGKQGAGGVQGAQGRQGEVKDDAVGRGEGGVLTSASEGPLWLLEEDRPEGRGHRRMGRGWCRTQVRGNRVWAAWTRSEQRSDSGYILKVQGMGSAGRGVWGQREGGTWGNTRACSLKNWEDRADVGWGRGQSGAYWGGRSGQVTFEYLLDDRLETFVPGHWICKPAVMSLPGPLSLPSHRWHITPTQGQS